MSSRTRQDLQGSNARLVRDLEQARAERDGAIASLERTESELAALQQEVIDVCLAAPQPQIVPCPYCKGARRVEGVHHTEYGPRCYYVDCAACAGRGVVIG